MSLIRYDMDAYGNVLSGSAGGLHLTTKERDSDTGLYWFGARWYDPVVGRWMEVDPLLIMQRYSMSYASPTIAVDPDGRAPVINWPGYGPVDLEFSPCNLDELLKNTNPCNPCNFGTNADKLRNALGKIVGILSGDAGRAGGIVPNSPEDAKRRGGGRTVGTDAYFNPRHPKTQGDFCAQACTCAHELVHVYQNGSGSGISGPMKELPAYIVEALCQLGTLGVAQ